MTTQLRHEISAATLENDLDTLVDLLCKHEYDGDDTRYTLYQAISRVARNLDVTSFVADVHVLD